MGNYIEHTDIGFWPAGYSTADKDAVINRVEEQIDLICHDVFYEHSATVTLDGNGQQRLPHEQDKKLTGVSSLTVDSSAISADSYSFNEVEIYYEDDAESVWNVEDTAPVFRRGIQNVVIAGDWGWETTPYSITRVAILMVQMELALIGEASPVPGGSAGFKSERLGDYSYTLADGQQPITGHAEIDRLIRPYIRSLRLRRI